MDLSNVSARIELQRAQPLRVEKGRGQRFVVLAGHVWVTQDRDARDRVLGAGEDFVLDRPGLALLTAIDGDAAVARLS